MAENLGASFSIDVTNLKAGLAQANRLIRESESEFKAAAAGMDDWSGSQEGLEARIKSLNSITDVQRKKVDALQSEYDRLISEGMNPASKEAVELRTKINNETAALNKNEKALGEAQEALDDFGNSADEAGDAADGAGKGMEGLGKVAGGVGAAVAAVGAACVAAVGAFLGLAESTRESRTAMGKLETAFATAGLSAQAAESTFSSLYGVIGDEGTATEAAQQLAQYANTEEELAEQTRILTGVFATYGDSIEMAGLAEGIASTIAMSEVQGTLADALEWQGVNLDDFNKKLAACATEQEREALITETLNGLYGEAADKYKEVNADVIAAQEAQAKLNLAMNELGAIAEPIMTTLKTLAADVLTSITPFVQMMGEGLSGALNGTAGAADQLASGISGILTTVLDMVTGMLPTVIDVIVAVVPQLLTALLARLPEILTALLGMITQIISALAEMLPQIVTAIMEVLPQLINALIAAIPQLLEAAVQLLMAIVNALPTIIASLITALPSVINTIINALVQSIPILIEAAIQLLMAIVEAIPTIIDALIAALPQIINCIIDGVINAIPQLLEGAIQLLMAIIEAIPTIIQALITALPQIITTITSTLLSKLPDIIQAAITIFLAIVQAIPQMLPQLIAAIPQIITSIVNGLTEGIGGIMQVGKDLIEGLWNGIKDMAGWIKEKIEGFGETVLTSLKNFFGIKSPSRVMRDQVGKQLAAGIAVGIEENANLAENATEKLSSIVLSAAESRLDEYQTYNEMSVAEEAAYWDEVRKQCAEGTAARLKADKKYFAAQKKLVKQAEDEKTTVEALMKDAAKVGTELANGLADSAKESKDYADYMEKTAEDLAKSVLSAAESRLDEYKTYNEMTLADEAAYWDEVRKQCAEGTDARLAADKKYLSAKKSLDDELIKAEEKYQKTVADTQKKVDDRAASIMSSMGLFDFFETSKAVSGKDLIWNLTSQVAGLSEWQTNLDKLADRVGKGDLYNAIKEMGAGSLNELRAINAMTDEELQQYVSLFGEKAALAKKQATDELGESNAQEVADAYKEYTESCAALGVEVGETNTQIKETVGGTMDAITEAATAANNALTESAEASLAAVQRVAAAVKEIFGSVGGVAGVDQLIGLSGAIGGSSAGGQSVVVNQTNNYAQAHSRFELWQSRKDIAAAVRLATV